MPQTPLAGLTYPDDQGHTRLWEHFQTLAEDVDALFVTVSGTADLTWAAASGNLSRANVTVTFAQPFAMQPVVSVNTGNGYRLGFAEGITTTDFLMKVFDLRAAATGDMTVAWTASGIVSR